MRYVRMWGLLVVVAAAVTAFTGTASATLTNGGGGKPTTIHAANSGNISLTGPVTITCTTSTLGGDVTTNDTGEAGGPLTTLTFSGCGSSTITVVQKGTLKATSSGTNTAEVYSDEADITALLHTFFGTVHCTYVTDETSIGTLTGTGHAKNPNTGAKLDLSGTIPVEEETSDGLCFEEPATLEGTYLVSDPEDLVINAPPPAGTLTDGSGGSPSTIHAANSGNVSLTGSVTLTCTASTLGADITTNNAEAASGLVTTLTFTGCGSSTVTVVKNGTLRVTDSGSNTATVVSSGVDITWLLHTVFGTTHCTYVTEDTDLGTLTGTGHANNSNTGAKLDIHGIIPIETKTSDGLCFDEPTTLEGSYVVSSPSMLSID